MMPFLRWPTFGDATKVIPANEQGHARFPHHLSRRSALNGSVGLAAMFGSRTFVLEGEHGGSILTGAKIVSRQVSARQV
jgi:hypothetical protein